MKQHDRRLVRAVKQALVPVKPGIAPGAAACAGMLFALGAGVAAAADTQEGELSEITVTGIRASIATAISMKEQSNNIIETISAEDLGKLPDLSIADSLARLPGLAAQRTDGRSNFISIRGFAADFSGTTLSGREQASSGENRGVEFDQYPAELINSVEVYKTPDASLIGQGIAGTVNLNTIKPLSSNELKMALNVRGERGSYENLNPGQGIGRSGSRISFSIVDQFLDRTKRSHEHTFFGRGIVAHIAFAHPVCEDLRALLLKSARACKARVHDGGTYVNMDGPAFSTRAESELNRRHGFDVIGMTNLPEAKLAREAEIALATMAGLCS